MTSLAAKLPGEVDTHEFWPPGSRLARPGQRTNIKKAHVPFNTAMALFHKFKRTPRILQRLEGGRHHHHHHPKTAWRSLWLAPSKTKPTFICMSPRCVIHKMASVCSCVLHGAHARETHVWFDQCKVRQAVSIFLMRTSRLPRRRHLKSSEGLPPTGRKCRSSWLSCAESCVSSRRLSVKTSGKKHGKR